MRFCVCLIISFLAFTNSIAAESYVLYRMDEQQFSIAFPQSWQTKPGRTGMTVLKGGPSGDSGTGCLVAFHRAKVLENSSPSEAAKMFQGNTMAAQFQQAGFSDVRIIEQRPIKLNSRDAGYSVLSYTIQGLDASAAMVSMLAVTNKRDQVYTLNCSARNTDFGRWKSVFSDVFNSFVVYP